MATIKFSKLVSTLPATLEPDTVYFVKTAAGVQLYITNHVGTLTAYAAALPTTLFARVVVVSASFTPLDTDSGALYVVDTSNDVVITLPSNLSIGWNASVFRMGTGNVTFVAGSGTALRQADGYTKLDKQYSSATLLVLRAAEVLCSGRMVA